MLFPDQSRGKLTITSQMWIKESECKAKINPHLDYMPKQKILNYVS